MTSLSSFDASDPGKPSFYVPFQSLAILEDSVSKNAKILPDSSLAFSYSTSDQTGDKQLNCLFAAQSFDSSDSSCECNSSLIRLDHPFDLCPDPKTLSCSASGFSLICAP